MTRQIIGSKGGGGASFVTKPDTLRSNDSFEILLGLGSGRWKGLVDGLKGLKINGVPMENTDGSSNFQDIYAIFADGNPLQKQLVTFKLGGGASSTSINTPLTNTLGSPGPWVSGAADTIGANFIDLRFVVQSLFYQDKKSLRENTATIEIEMRPSGTSEWINPLVTPNSNGITYDQNGYDYTDPEFQASLYTAYFGRSLFNAGGTGFRASASSNLSITGKTNSAYVKEIRIAVPNAGIYANKTWQVRARLLEKDTVDNGDIQERRNIIFESIAGVKNEPLGEHPDWTGLVWMQIHGKASDQFNGFPEVEGVFDTKICKVPPASIFNPETRAYTNGIWDGSYEERFTMDPAWQIKEFIEDPIHGLAGLQPGTTVDKWDCLEASKYYSELVPDGKGGTHPRFNLNLTINEARDVDEMVGYLSGAVNSYMEDVGGGVWRLKVDKPETPVMLFTEDNIFGEFSYSHTDVDTRFNDWRGTFIDEDLDYEVNTARVFDQDDIDLNGIKFTEIALVGCTNHQEALRRLMFRQRVSLNEYKIVTFQTNRMARYISPLDTILVADGALNADHLVKSTSRLASASGTTVTLMRPVRLEIGVNYTMNFTTASGEVVVRNVTNPSGFRGDVTTIGINAALPDDVIAESAVALQATGLPANPVSYRVMGVERSEEDEDSYTVIASIIDSGKWNAMDNVSAEELNAQEARVFIDPPTAPEDGMFETLSYATDLDVKRVLQVNWNRPGGKYLDGYRVEYSFNSSSYQLLAANTKDTIFEFENPEDGTYVFRITALDRRKVESTPLYGQFVLDGSRIFKAPTHVRGTLSERPAVGPYEGFRYTITNVTPPVTQVWETGAWVNENNLVVKGTDIGVEDGATVGMTPAERAELDALIEGYGEGGGSVAEAIQAAIDAQAALAAAEIAKVAAEAAEAAAAASEAAAAASEIAAGVSATSASGSASSIAGQVATATDAASAAATSASLAAGYVGTATTQAGISTTQATAATNAASTATTQAGLAATYKDAAFSSAEAASSSATTASAAGATATTQAGIAAGHVGTATTKAQVATDAAVVATDAAAAASTSSGLSATYRDEAYTNAQSAISSAATATSQAASATSSATLSASVGLGGHNKNPTFADWAGASGTLPADWADWIAGTSNTKVTGDLGGFAFQQDALAGSSIGIQSSPPGLVAKKSTGWYVMEAEVTLVSGSLIGSGFYAATTGFAYNKPFSTIIDPTTGAAYGVGTAGKKYKFSHIFQQLGTGTDWVFILMSNWSGFGTTEAKTIKWHRGIIRDATPAEIRDKTVLEPMETTVSTSAAAIETLNTKTASYVTRVTAGVGTAELSLVAADINGNAASTITLKADKIKLGSATQAVLEISGGNATFGSDVYIQNGKLVLDTGTYMKVQGLGFGTSSQFVEWFGPKMAFNLCSESNAITYIKANGDAYFGGTLFAGTYRNAIQGTALAADATAELGPFATAGGVKQVILSYNYNYTKYGSTSNTPNATVNPTATIVLEKWNGSTWVNLTTLNVTGSILRVMHDNAEGFTGYVSSSMSGSVTYTDSAAGTADVIYRGRITARGESTFSGTVSSEEKYQTIGVISTEE